MRGLDIRVGSCLTRMLPKPHPQTGSCPMHSSVGSLITYHESFHAGISKSRGRLAADFSPINHETRNRDALEILTHLNETVLNSQRRKRCQLQDEALKKFPPMLGPWISEDYVGPNLAQQGLHPKNLNPQ